MAEPNKIPTPEDMLTAVGALGEIFYMLLTTCKAAGFSHADAMDIVKSAAMSTFSNIGKANQKNGEAV